MSKLIYIVESYYSLDNNYFRIPGTFYGTLKQCRQYLRERALEFKDNDPQLLDYGKILFYTYNSTSYQLAIISAAPIDEQLQEQQ